MSELRTIFRTLRTLLRTLAQKIYQKLSQLDCLTRATLRFPFVRVSCKNTACNGLLHGIVVALEACLNRPCVRFSHKLREAVHISFYLVHAIYNGPRTAAPPQTQFYRFFNGFAHLFLCGQCLVRLSAPFLLHFQFNAKPFQQVGLVKVFNILYVDTSGLHIYVGVVGNT